MKKEYIAKEYTLKELIVSTHRRIEYNMSRAMDYFKVGNMNEYLRFLNNVRMMIDDIEYAIENNDKNILMDNRDFS